MTQVTAPKPMKHSTRITSRRRNTCNDCVHCGICLPAYPTYVLWGEEMDSPRGRIYMMRKAVDGEAPLDAQFRLAHGQMPGLHGLHDGLPLGRAVQQADRAHARADRAQCSRAAWASGCSGELIFATFPHAGAATRVGCADAGFTRGAACRTGWCGKTRMTACCRNGWRPWRPCCPRCPGAFESRRSAFAAAAGSRRRRVGMLSGCVQQVFFPQVNAATARVLAAEGCEVIIAPRAAVLRRFDAALRTGRPRRRRWRGR